MDSSSLLGALFRGGVGGGLDPYPRVIPKNKSAGEPRSREGKGTCKGRRLDKERERACLKTNKQSQPKKTLLASELLSVSVQLLSFLPLSPVSSLKV